MRDALRDTLAKALVDARRQTLQLNEHMKTPEQWQVPYLRIVNPPLWEFAHVAWFQEYWCLRRQQGRVVEASSLEHADDYFDSRYVEHRSRWTLPFPSAQRVYAYAAEVLERVLEQLSRSGNDDESLYFHRLALFHEQMHIEAQAYTWQTLAVALPFDFNAPDMGGRPAAFLEFAAAPWTLGSPPNSGFVFDNEKWAHAVELDDFALADRPVSNAEFMSFVEAGGYRRAEFWEPAVFEQLRNDDRNMPIYWRRSAQGYEQRHFNTWRALPPNEPVLHVNAHEAQAYCRWAGGDLPSEAEWERAAMTDTRLQWGRHGWEWTRSPFEPFEGFSVDAYADYSRPAFGQTRVLRGASSVTPRGMVHPKFRNFFDPQRQDMFVSFRVCRH